MTKLVCFDFDDTLVQGLDSVKFLCILNGHEADLPPIDQAEAAGEYGWIEADHRRAVLCRGLEVSKVEPNFFELLKPIQQINETVSELHSRGVKVIVITAGPVQVAEAACRLWRLDGFAGSLYGEENGRLTGTIDWHMGDEGKLAALDRLCASLGIPPEACTAVGDGGSDIPLFGYCGSSIAINYGPAAEGKAKHYLRTENCMDILDFI